MSAGILVVHDYFGIRGGGERTALTLAAAFEAALLYGYRTEDSFETPMFPDVRRDLALPERFRRRGLRIVALARSFAAARDYVAGFPRRIFSGVVAPFAAPEPNAAGRNILYCHTPPRFLYDQREFLVGRLTPIQQVAARLALPVFRRHYEKAVARMDVIVANSANVQARIARYLGRDSVVIHPPCNTDMPWRGQGDYYLSMARLAELKRVDRVIAAFRRMPDKRLIVASGGEMEAALRAQAADAPNIHFTGWIDDARMQELVGGAIATVYVPVDEDFGISPVESMAAGKPCISVAEGGSLETLVDGETGILLRPDFGVDDLVDAVAAMTPQRALSMRAACVARAARFDQATFVDRMRAVIEGPV